MDLAKGFEEKVGNKVSRSNNQTPLARKNLIIAASVFCNAENKIRANGEIKMIVEKEKLPQDFQHEEVKGVFVGGCIDRGEGSRFRAKAHAHTQGMNKGWLCFLSIKRINEPMLVKHEVAHILTEDGHTDKWRKKVLELGGTLDACNSVIDGFELMRSYQKRIK